MTHLVKFIDDDQLPEGIDWAATEGGGRCVLFVKTSKCPYGRIPAAAVRAVMRLRGYSSASSSPAAANA